MEAFADIILGFGGSSEWFAQLEFIPFISVALPH